MIIILSSKVKVSVRGLREFIWRPCAHCGLWLALRSNRSSNEVIVNALLFPQSALKGCVLRPCREGVRVKMPLKSMRSFARHQEVGRLRRRRCGLESNEHGAWRLLSAGDCFLLYRLRMEKANHNGLPSNDLIKRSWKAHSTSVPVKQTAVAFEKNYTVKQWN